MIMIMLIQNDNGIDIDTDDDIDVEYDTGPDNDNGHDNDTDKDTYYNNANEMKDSSDNTSLKYGNKNVNLNYPKRLTGIVSSEMDLTSSFSDYFHVETLDSSDFNSAIVGSCANKYNELKQTTCFSNLPSDCSSKQKRLFLVRSAATHFALSTKPSPRASLAHRLLSRPSTASVVRDLHSQ